MKRFFLVLFLFLTLGLFPFENASASNIFTAGVLSAFRNVQARVSDIQARLGRFLGIEAVSPSTPPFLRLASFPDSSEFVIGSTEEIRWTYRNLRGSVTKIYLLPQRKPSVLLVFLPARRNSEGSDHYSFPIRFEPGTYDIRVCNGETCDEGGPISFVFASSEERGFLDVATSTSSSTSPTSTNP
ncbi:MAG: hypothetical protein Q8R20_02495 [Nanoarchaeota archaeon]|nr:hypothetical protein [Nanoarchaeota archaeon]